MIAADLAEVLLVEAAHRRRRRADPDARGDRRRPLVERHGVAVDGQLDLVRAAPPRPCPSTRCARRSSWRRCVSVPPVSTSSPPVHAARRRARRRSRAPGAGTRGTPRSPAIRKHVALAAIVCSSGPPCMPGKTARSTACACSSRQRTKPERGPASVLCVVEVTKSQCVDRVRVQPGGDEPREVRHVAQQQRADLVGDLAEAVGLDRARVGRAAADDQLRPVLLREREHLVVVDDARLAARRRSGRSCRAARRS